MLYPELKMPFMALRTQNKESVEDATEAQLASAEDIELAMVCFLLRAFFFLSLRLTPAFAFFHSHSPYKKRRSASSDLIDALHVEKKSGGENVWGGVSRSGQSTSPCSCAWLTAS